MPFRYSSASAATALLATVLLITSRFTSAQEVYTRDRLVPAARDFPAMPRGTADLAPFVDGLPTFSSGAPFNDLEFTVFDTDYMDGENSGYDVFMPVDPSDPNPGSDFVKYIKTALNPDLDFSYGAAQGDRIVLGTAEIEQPFFLRGPNGVDDDYAVVQHFDYDFGHIQLHGAREDYQLLRATIAEDSVATDGYYLFYVGALAAQGPDLVAFVFECDDLAQLISGQFPRNSEALCNATGELSLDDAAQFRFAEALPTEVALPGGIAQVGTSGKEVVSGVTADAEGNTYLFGLTDGDLAGDGGPLATPNVVFVTRVNADGSVAWTTQIPLSDGSIFKDAVADGEYLYAAGRTLSALEGFTNGGRWDGIIAKLRLSDGGVVATDQYASPGIDGYGNAALDGAGNLYVSAQGALPNETGGQGGTDREYLVAKHRTDDLANVWRVIEAPDAEVIASAEAWGGLTYVPATEAHRERLVAGGWYFAARGAEAFATVYEDLDAPTPTRIAYADVVAAGTSADWVLDNAVGPDGSIYVGGYVTQALPGQQDFGLGDAYLAKFSPNLTDPVYYQFGTAQTDLVRKVEVGSDGVVYAVGYTYGDLYAPNADTSAGRSGDVFVLKLDADLGVIASTQFGTAGEDRTGLKLAGERLYLGGMTEASLTGESAGSFDAWVAALDAETLEPTEAGPVTGLFAAAESVSAAQAFPNPASDRLAFGLPGEDWSGRAVRLRVFDARGGVVLTRDDYRAGQRLDVGGLAGGLYRAVLEASEGPAAAATFVVAR